MSIYVLQLIPLLLYKYLSLLPMRHLLRGNRPYLSPIVKNTQIVRLIQFPSYSSYQSYFLRLSWRVQYYNQKHLVTTANITVNKLIDHTTMRHPQWPSQDRPYGKHSSYQCPTVIYLFCDSFRCNAQNTF